MVQVSDFSLGRGMFLAAALQKLGLDVVTITNAPVYQKEGRSRGTPGSPRNADVRVPFAKTLYGSVLGRLLYYFAFSALTFRELVKARPSVLYSRGPYPFTEITCQVYRWFFPGAVIVSDTTDLWPDSLEYVELSPRLKKLFLRFGLALSRAAYRNVDSVVTHNEPIARVLRERFHRPTSIIYGAIDLSQFGGVGRDEALGFLDGRAEGLSEKFILLYAGLLGPFQNPEAISEIAERMGGGTAILVAGRGPLERRLRERAAANGSRGVVFLGTLPFEDMPTLYSAADACLLTYPDLPFLKIGLPKKFIEYAASGRPIVCMTPECVAKELCEEWDAGVCVGPNEFEAAVEAIERMKADRDMRAKLGSNARRMAEELFSYEAASRTLGEVLEDAFAARVGRR